MIKLIKSDNIDCLKKWKYDLVNIVYFDPPYNTKNSELIFSDKINSWSNFFEERLVYTKKILEKNSVIFTSIGYQELPNALFSLEKVFGKSSLVSIMPRITFQGHKTSKTIINSNDFLIVTKVGNVEFNGLSIDEKVYKLTDNHEYTRGKFYIRRLDYKSFKYSKKMDFEVLFENKIYLPGDRLNNEDAYTKRHLGYSFEKDWCWIWSRQKVQFALKNEFLFEKNGYLYKKTYTNCEIKKNEIGEYYIYVNKRDKKIDSLFLTNTIFKNNIIHNGIEKLFSYPKPYSLIEEILSWPKIENKKILDPFAGIGTTGIIGFRNKYDVYLIQKSEKIKKNSETYKMGYKNIFDITKENFIKNKIEVEVIE